MSAAEFLRRYAGTLSNQTPYERRFVERVLPRVANLDWSAVQPQTAFTDQANKRRYIDFGIAEGHFVRIAVEVDGYDKTGSGQGMTRQEFADWSLREQAIAADGWRVIRIANSLVDREPDKCARTIELVLKRERALAERLEAAPARDRVDPAEARKQLAGELLDQGERAELNALAEVNRQAIEELEQQLATEMHRREEAERGRDRAHEEQRGMVTIARYFAIALVVLVTAGAIVAVVVARQGGDAGSESACEGGSDWRQAPNHVGDTTTIRGPVTDTRYDRRLRGSPTFLNIGQPFPDPERFVVVIWGDARPAFPNPPETAFDGRAVAVTGKVREFRGVPQIEADSPADITVC